MGSGQFIGPKTIEVALADGGKQVFSGKKIVIGTGSRSTIDPVPGLVEAGPMTHVEVLELDHIPKHLLILGGGYVGLELAQAMRRFGSKVTIIDRNDRLAHREDPDVSEALQELFRDEGIEIMTEVVVKRVEGKSGQAVKVHGTRGGKEITLEGTHILVATGRTPNTQGIGLNLTVVETTKKKWFLPLK